MLLGLRRLVATFTGPVVRLMRTADNVELDFFGWGWRWHPASGRRDQCNVVAGCCDHHRLACAVVRSVWQRPARRPVLDIGGVPNV